MRQARGWRHNLGLKVLSLSLALLLWSFVHGTKRTEREMMLALEFVGLPDSLTLAAPPPRTARVVLAGATQEFVFRRLLPGATLRVDLSEARSPAARILPGSPAVSLRGGGDLEVVRMLEPAILELPLDRRIERAMPVRVTTRGTTAPGFVAGSARAEPRTCRVRGPASRLATAREVETEPVDIARQDRDVETSAVLLPPVPGAECDPTDVRVFVPILRDRGAESLPANHRSARTARNAATR
jgi:hypothetical protein